MEDCLICYSKQKSFKILPCQHKLCHSCFLKLDTCICPYCREKFYYTKKESIKRAQMNIDYRNWHPPSQLAIPEGFTNINRNNVNNINVTLIGKVISEKGIHFDSHLDMKNIKKFDHFS